MPRVRRKTWGKRISSRSSERRMIWGVGLVLLAVIVGSLAAYYAQRIALTPSPGANPAEPSVSTINPKPMTGADVAEAYVLKQGGQKVLDTIKSVRVAGTLTVAGAKYKFEMAKKDPNLVRFMVENKAGTLMLGKDGQGAWVAYRNAAGSIKVWEADAATQDWLWLQAPIGSWLAHPEAPAANFTLGANAGAGMLPVAVVSPGGRKITYYLEAGEMRQHRMELTDTQAGPPTAQAQLEKMQLAENKVWLPYKLLGTGPGGVAVEIEIEHLRFNSGILNAMFDRPTQEDGAKVVSAAKPPITIAQAMGASAADTAGVHKKLDYSFDANAMQVHGFAAQTNAFQEQTVPRIEPGTPAADQPPVLADYGFPWPVPW